MHSKYSIKGALMKNVDTDVIVLAVAHFLDLEIDELWVERGAGKKNRCLPSHVYPICSTPRQVKVFVISLLIYFYRL